MTLLEAGVDILKCVNYDRCVAFEVVASVIFVTQNFVINYLLKRPRHKYLFQIPSPEN